MASDPNTNHDISMESASSNVAPTIISNSLDAVHELANGNSAVSQNNNNNANAPQQLLAMQTTEQTSPIFEASSSLEPEAAKEMDMEVWANSLVGRWWEIFWEPNEENGDGDDNNIAPPEGDRVDHGNSGSHSYQVGDNTQDVVMSIRGGGVEDDDTTKNKGAVVKMEDATTQSTNNTSITTVVGQQQQRQKQASLPIHQRKRPHHSSVKHKKTSSQQRRRTSQQQSSQPYQHRPRFLDYDAAKKQSQPPPQPPLPVYSRPQPVMLPLPQSTPITRPQTVSFNVVYHESKLGLSLRHQQQQQGGEGTPTTTQIVITEVSPNAPNASLVQVGDVIVGVNGKRFPSSSGSTDDQRKAYFIQVVTALKDAPRPMTVNFERRLMSVANTATPKNAAAMAVVPKVEAPQLVGGITQSNYPVSVVQQSKQVRLDGGVGQNIMTASSSNSAVTVGASTNSNAGAATSVDDNKKYNPKAPAKLTERELQCPLEPATDFPPGWNKRIVPRETQSATAKKTYDTYYYSPVQGYKFRSRPEVRQFLELLSRNAGDEVVAYEEFRREKSRKRNKSPSATTQSSTAMEVDGKEDVPIARLKKEMGAFDEDTQSESDASESDATSTADDDDDDDTGADAIDWYDGKILSYADGNFVVYFLGDTEDVTYTMPLTPKIVRPSVRAWTKRTLALLSCDVDLIKDGAIPDEIADSLPPSTSIPQDENTLACDSENGDESNHNMRLIQYSKLLETQIQLAKQLSPHADDDLSGGTVDGEDEGPGPFANKSYVKHLRSCLEESKKVCAWLSREVDALNVFNRVNGASNNHQDPLATAHVSKDSIQKFLVNGAKFLQRILALIPNKREKVSDEQSSRNVRKRRRTNTNELSEQQNSDNVLPKVSSNDLDEAMNSILNRSGEDKQQMLMTSTLNQIVSVLYIDLWQPYQDWIKEAEDMVYGKSSTFYSIEAIESHVHASQKITLFDISSWRIDLEAKLNRARFFEMEAWSAIKACTALDESGNADASSDSCQLALTRLRNELSSSTHAAGEQSIMRNINPLGKQSVSANGTHSLTRDDIENAIKIRQWILDLVHAKISRERVSFVQVSDYLSRKHL